MVLGIASTAMPFARTPEAQAERWLRLLRQHGDAGVALQALGVADAPQQEAEPALASGPSEGRDAHRDVHAVLDPVAEVGDGAARIADRRGVTCVSTVDVLLAVMRVYGEDFDRVLGTHGTDRDTVLLLLGAQVPEAAAS